MPLPLRSAACTDTPSQSQCVSLSLATRPPDQISPGTYASGPPGRPRRCLGTVSFKETDPHPSAIEYLLGILGGDLLSGFSIQARTSLSMALPLWPDGTAADCRSDLVTPCYIGQRRALE